jgi:subtilase family serine protease
VAHGLVRPAAIIALLLVAACTPDLRPEIRANNSPACDLQQSEVIITVRNDGSEAAASKTAVTFAHKNSPVTVDTPAIATKSQVLVRVPIPPPIPTTIAFDVTVDAEETITESDESNNALVNVGC